MNQSPPKFSGDAEYCSSSESGWTMYLASSSMHGDTSNGDIDDEGEVEVGSGTITVQSSGDDEAEEEDDDNDDSMASDASSGTPCKQYWHDDVICDVKHGSHVCGDGDGVVKEKKKKSSQCTSRCSRKNHKVERGEKKGRILFSNVSEEEGNGDSISIHGGSKMRRVKFSEK